MIHRVSGLKARMKHLTRCSFLRKEVTPHNGVLHSLLGMFKGIRSNNFNHSIKMYLVNSQVIVSHLCTVKLLVPLYMTTDRVTNRTDRHTACRRTSGETYGLIDHDNYTIWLIIYKLTKNVGHDSSFLLLVVVVAVCTLNPASFPLLTYHMFFF